MDEVLVRELIKVHREGAEHRERNLREAEDEKDLVAVPPAHRRKTVEEKLHGQHFGRKHRGSGKQFDEEVEPVLHAVFYSPESGCGFDLLGFLPWQWREVRRYYFARFSDAAVAGNWFGEVTESIESYSQILA